jgi:hypothetical protein
VILCLPFFFLIVMEVLSRMMVAVVSGGFISGFLVGDRNANTLAVSHLLFADDTFIFCGVAPDNLRYLRCVLLCFEAVSGLKINLAKFELVPIGCVPNVNALANILGCMVSSLPLKYLGLPLGAPFKAKFLWGYNY